MLVVNALILVRAAPSIAGIIPDTPSLSVAAVSSSTIELTIGNVAGEDAIHIRWSPNGTDTWTDISELEADTAQYEAIGLLPSTARYFQVAASSIKGQSVWSATESATTDAELTKPGSPTAFALSDNGDGTVNISFTLADSLATLSEVQIWVNGTLSWDSIKNLDSTPSAEFTNNVTIPGSSGAVVNVSGEFGLRLQVGNSQGDEWSNEHWLILSDTDTTVTAGELGAISVLSSTSLSIPLSVDPTNYTSIKLQRSLTGGTSGGSWSDLFTATDLNDFPYTDSSLTVDVKQYYRQESTDGTDTVYSAIVSATPTAAPAGLIFEDDFESGDFSKTQNGFRWSSFAKITNSTDRFFSGTRSARFYFEGKASDQGDAFSEMRFDLGGQYTELWIRYQLYKPANYFHREPGSPEKAANNKGLVFLWGGGDYPGKLSTNTNFMSTGPDDSGDSKSDFGYKKNSGSTGHHDEGRIISPILANDGVGAWIDFKIHIKASDVGGANGVFELWKNDQLAHAWYALENWHATDHYYDSGYLLGHANSGFANDTYMYIDEFKIGTTEASVG